MDQMRTAPQETTEKIPLTSEPKRLLPIAPFFSTNQSSNPPKKVKIDSARVTRGVKASVKSLLVKVSYPSKPNKSIVPSMTELMLTTIEPIRRPSASRDLCELVGWNSLKVSKARDSPLIRADITLKVL